MSRILPKLPHSTARLQPTNMNLLLRLCLAVMSALLPFISQVQAGQGGLATVNLTTPNGDFADAGAGMVLHKPTGLIWKRCMEGQVWLLGFCTYRSEQYTWQEAVERPAALNDGRIWWGGQNFGKTDWRLPSLNELRSILELGSYAPAINREQFPGHANDVFWSSSPSSVSENHAWAVDFIQGMDIARKFAAGTARVRLVRAGTGFQGFDLQSASIQVPAPSAPLIDLPGERPSLEAASPGNPPRAAEVGVSRDAQDSQQIESVPGLGELSLMALSLMAAGLGLWSVRRKS